MSREPGPVSTVLVEMHVSCTYTPESIAEALGHDPRMIADILERLVRSGQVIRAGKLYQKKRQPRKKRKGTQLDWISGL